LTDDDEDDDMPLSPPLSHHKNLTRPLVIDCDDNLTPSNPSHSTPHNSPSKSAPSRKSSLQKPHSPRKSKSPRKSRKSSDVDEGPAHDFSPLIITNPQVPCSLQNEEAHHEVVVADVDTVAGDAGHSVSPSTSADPVNTQGKIPPAIPPAQPSGPEAVPVRDGASTMHAATKSSKKRGRPPAQKQRKDEQADGDQERAHPKKKRTAPPVIDAGCRSSVRIRDKLVVTHKSTVASRKRT
ncbi:hypothetical protein BDN72DRAFT_866259, partial [Pluteus cervinus]